MSDSLKQPLFGPTLIPGYVASCPWCGTTGGVNDFQGLRAHWSDEKTCHRCGRCFCARPLHGGHLIVPMRDDGDVAVMTGKAVES